MHIANYTGLDMVKLDLAPLFGSIGERGYIMHRTALHSALAVCVKPEQIQTDERALKVQATAQGAEVFIDGETNPVTADLVIGADGLRSVVRQYVVGNEEPRYAGEIILRGISNRSTDFTRSILVQPRRPFHLKTSSRRGRAASGPRSGARGRAFESRRAHSGSPSPLRLRWGGGFRSLPLRAASDVPTLIVVIRSTWLTNGVLHRPYGRLPVEREGRREVPVSLDLRLQIGDLLLRGGNGIGAGDTGL
jgi:hypothetical protein